MKKLIAAATCAALAALPAAAIAKPRAKVYRGTFQAVGSDGAYTDGKFGKAQLVDGKRNDKLSVHVRHLGAKTRYVFRLQETAASACEEGAPGGTDVRGWRYRRAGVLRTSRKGNANSWARSHTFTADRTKEYFVGVYTATPTGDPGEIVLCAKLTTKGKKGGKKPDKHRGKKPAKPDKPDKPGKSGDKPGKGPEQRGGGKPPHSPKGARAKASRTVLR